MKTMKTSSMLSHWHPEMRLFALCGVCLLLQTGAGSRCTAQYLHVAEQGNFDKSGTLAYLIVQGKLSHITAVKCSSNTVQVLFTKSLSNEVVLPPVCVSNGVVIVNMNGLVTKYALDGTQLFATRLLKTDEVSRLAGSWDHRTVYLAAMHYEGNIPNRKPRYRILWIDIQGGAPVTKEEVDVGLPLKVFRVDNDIVVCGPENTERIPAPKELRR